MMWLGVDTELLAQLKWAIGGAQQFGEAVMLIIWGLGIAAAVGAWTRPRPKRRPAQPCVRRTGAAHVSAPSPDS
jgi:hypothetical protein